MGGAPVETAGAFAAQSPHSLTRSPRRGPSQVLADRIEIRAVRFAGSPEAYLARAEGLKLIKRAV